MQEGNENKNESMTVIPLPNQQEMTDVEIVLPTDEDLLNLLQDINEKQKQLKAYCVDIVKQAWQMLRRAGLSDTEIIQLNLAQAGKKVKTETDLRNEERRRRYVDRYKLIPVDATFALPSGTIWTKKGSGQPIKEVKDILMGGGNLENYRINN